MYLTENQLNQHMSNIQVGDWFTIVGDKGKMHCVVEKKFGDELLIKNNDTKKYSVHTNSAIEGDMLTMYLTPNNKDVIISFKAIIISDKNREEKFKILPQAEDAPDPAIEEKIIEDCKKNREEIMKELGNLKQFSEFTFFVGDYIYDNDGDSVIKDGTESIIKFKVESYTANLFICDLVSASGKYRRLFEKYKEEDFYIYMNSKLLNTSEKFKKNVALQIWHEKDSKTPIILKDVYAVDIMDGEKVKDGEEDTQDDDDDDLDEPRSMEDLLKDKDLMKLMNYQSIWDKALGRKAKGVKPINDLKGKEPLNTLFGFDKKPGQRVTFRYLGESSLRGKELSLVKGKTYTGIMRDATTIKLSVRNSKEKVFIAVGDEALRDNKRKITVTYRKPSGEMDRDIQINGYIQITK